MSNKLKNSILLIFLSLLLPANSSYSKEDFTLQCSYITAKTDFHVKLSPMTFKSNGDVYRNGEKIGKAFKSENDYQIFLALEKGSLFSLDLDSWLSIYSFVLDDKTTVKNFGTCQLLEN